MTSWAKKYPAAGRGLRSPPANLYDNPHPTSTPDKENLLPSMLHVPRCRSYSRPAGAAVSRPFFAP